MEDDISILIKTIREFSNEKIKPIAADIDQNEQVPEPFMSEIKELGLLGIPFPESYGGSGFGWRAYYAVIKELAKIEGSIPAIIGAHTTIAANAIYIAGTASQKEQYLTPLAKGDYLGAFALTEPGAGSNAAGITTTADQDGDDWVLNGTKCFITNAPSADIFIVFAATDKNKGAKGGITSFIVEKGTPGLTVGKKESKLGIRGSETSDVMLDNVKVPSSQMLGKEGDAFKYAMKVMQNGRISIAVQSLGLAKGAFEFAVTYATERIQFNKPISEFQLIQGKVAEMKMKLFAMESMVEKTIDLLEEDKPFNLEASIIKAYASEEADNIINEGLQILGGNGYMTDYPVERMMRDARINRIYEGTSEIQRMVIAKEVFKKSP